MDKATGCDEARQVVTDVTVYHAPGAWNSDYSMRPDFEGAPRDSVTARSAEANVDMMVVEKPTFIL